MSGDNHWLNCKGSGVITLAPETTRLEAATREEIDAKLKVAGWVIQGKTFSTVIGDGIKATISTIQRMYSQLSELPLSIPMVRRQLEFLRLLKDFLIERETVEKRDLIQSPFTVLHPQGIRGVFTPAEIDEILSLTGKLAA